MPSKFLDCEECLNKYRQHVCDDCGCGEHFEEGELNFGDEIARSEVCRQNKADVEEIDFDFENNEEFEDLN